MANTLRYHKTWLALGWLLIAVVVTLTLMPKPPASVMGIVVWDKLGHTLAYLVLMGWFAQLYPNRRPGLALGFVAMGVGLEFLQALGGVRHLEIADMIANSLGVLVAWVLSYTACGRLLPTIECWLGSCRR